NRCSSARPAANWNGPARCPAGAADCWNRGCRRCWRAESSKPHEPGRLLRPGTEHEGPPDARPYRDQVFIKAQRTPVDVHPLCRAELREPRVKRPGGLAITLEIGEPQVG